MLEPKADRYGWDLRNKGAPWMANRHVRQLMKPGSRQRGFFCRRRPGVAILEENPLIVDEIEKKWFKGGPQDSAEF
jgi:hypothetical protein